MRKLLLGGASALMLCAGAASAGESRHERSDGMKLHIKCVSAGCTVRGQQPGGKWGMVEKGPGGNKNYKKMVAKYQAMGFQ